MREPLQIHYIQYGGVPKTPEFLPTGSTYRPDRNIIAACEIAGISVAEARGPSRLKDVSYKRFHVMAILRSWGRSLPQIGRLLNRDHTTILHGLRRWETIDADILTYAPRPNVPHSKCVYWNTKRGRWLVRIWAGGGKYIGHFADYDEAVAARDIALSSLTQGEGE